MECNAVRVGQSGPAGRGRQLKSLTSLAAILLTTAWATSFASAKPRTRTVEDWENGSYVGSQTCIDCHEHEARGETFALTRHGRTGKVNWEGASGCESCHGPGEEHSRDKGKTGKIFLLEEMPKKEVDAICMSCHQDSQHSYWQTGVHQARGLSCISCHQIHHDGMPPKGLLAKGNVTDTCGSCHLQKKATLARSSHMPLREGSMDCTSCHNPHGSAGPSQLRAVSVNENCYECHAEKRSPVLWEHLPVRESCANCHDPHGTMHPKLLKARTPRLCQQCHDPARHPTQPYGGNFEEDTGFFPRSNRVFGRACLNCHPQVHGSNHPSGVRFQR